MTLATSERRQQKERRNKVLKPLQATISVFIYHVQRKDCSGAVSRVYQTLV
jgi:hypothetical protein